MNWLNKLEKKFGRYAIHNLTKYLIGAYVIGYGIYYLMPSLLGWMTLEPGLILKGQVWRLVSWILIPPQGNILFVVIMLMFYYSLGTTMEHTWGDFRFNVYIFGGIIFTAIGAFILYFLTGGALGLGLFFSTYYINMSIFLAFAASNPNMEIMLYFILPIKVKWLALVYAALILSEFVRGNAVMRVAIVASLLNFFVFFLSSRNLKPYMPKERARKAKFKKDNRPEMIYPGGARHRCAVCGRTELDDPTLEFRFCSKCNGNYEYCQEHLFTHKHVE